MANRTQLSWNTVLLALLVIQHFAVPVEISIVQENAGWGRWDKYQRDYFATF